MASGPVIGEHFEAFIQSLVESGRYATADDVLRDSLRLLEQRENSRVAQIESLKIDIADGLASGPSEPLDIAEIKKFARALSSQDAL